jgi:hypothetical protein
VSSGFYGVLSEVVKKNLLGFHRSFFNEAIEAVPALSDDGNKRVNTILQQIKQDMRLQIMCLKVVDL